MSVVSKASPSFISSLVSWLFFGGKLVGGLLVTFTVVLYLNQDRLLYFPKVPGMPESPDQNPRGMVSPDEWAENGTIRRKDTESGIPFEDKMITTADNVQIHTWLMLHEDSENLPTLIYFHGNAGNMGFRLKNAALMYGKAHMNILMVDYRGYGKSQGNPTEKGLQLDGEAAVQYAKNHPRLKNSKLVVFGRSLGGALCMYLAEKFPQDVHGVIVENTFLSIYAMVDVVMPFLKPVKDYVLNMKWDSDKKIVSLKQPILFISGERDELVPRAHMETLHQLATSSVHREFYSVKGGTHNDSWERAGLQYYKKMREFVDAYVQKTYKEGEPGGKEEEISETTSAPEEGVEGTDEDYDMVEDLEPSSYIPTMKGDFTVQ